MQTKNIPQKNQNWLVVSTHLKNISQIGNLPQIGLKIKHIWNHHLEIQFGDADNPNIPQW